MGAACGAGPSGGGGEGVSVARGTMALACTVARVGRGGRCVRRTRDCVEWSSTLRWVCGLQTPVLLVRGGDGADWGSCGIAVQSWGWPRRADAAGGATLPPLARAAVPVRRKLVRAAVPVRCAVGSVGVGPGCCGTVVAGGAGEGVVGVAHRGPGNRVSRLEHPALLAGTLAGPLARYALLGLSGVRGRCPPPPVPLGATERWRASDAPL